MVLVSVVVPARNSATTIKDCLESIKASTYRNFELIVVDGKSTDATVEIAKSLGVKVLTGSGRGRQADHNIGINQARGEIIALTDADCIVDRQWLEKIVGCFKDAQVGAAGGPNTTDTRGSTKVELAAGHIYDFIRLTATKTGTDAIVGCNSAYRKSCLVEAGGFDERLPGAGDTELLARILEQGYTVAIDPECVVYHRRRASFSELLPHFWEYGWHMGAVHRQNPKALQARKNHIYLLLIGWLLLLALIGLSFKYVAALWILASLLVAYLIFQFVLHRYLVRKSRYKSNFIIFLVVSTLCMMVYAMAFAKNLIFPVK